jgi:rod shape-determining protein MreC
MRFWRSLGWFVAAIVILIISFQFPGLNRGVHNLFDSISKPFLAAGSGIRDMATGLRFNFGKFWNAVAREREYQTRILELESKLLGYDELDRENQRLKKLLNFSLTIPCKTIGVRLIGEGSTPWRSVVLLDKGARRGIKADMALVAPEGLAGRVLEAGPLTSRAILLPDPDCRVSALTGTGRVQGVVTGTGTGLLRMKYLALDAEIAIGEEVITSGIESIFPKGIRIGKIESVEKDPDGLHLLATVRPSAPFSKLEEVLCLVSQPSK